jgi:F420-dependent oxidoreductase-like protein
MVSDVSFGAFIWPEGMDFEEIKGYCLRAEALKYDLFMITDHFMNMRKPERPDRHPLESWTTLAGLAACTNKIGLAPLVTCYAYRAPAVLAKMATNVDIISGGRLVFGIGAGWHETEFKAYFGRYPPARERLRGLEETVEICKSMFVNEHTTYHGKLFSVENALNSPRPVQIPIPILVGGGGEKRTLRIVAKHADFCHFFANDLKTLDQKLTALKRHCKDVGRDYDEITKGVGVSVVVGRDNEEAEFRCKRLANLFSITAEDQRKQLGRACGTPKAVAEFLETYIAKGVGLLTPRFFHMDNMELFGEEVLPAIA